MKGMLMVSVVNIRLLNTRLLNPRLLNPRLLNPSLLNSCITAGKLAPPGSTINKVHRYNWHVVTCRSGIWWGVPEAMQERMVGTLHK